MIIFGAVERFDGRSVSIKIPLDRAGEIARLIEEKGADTVEIRIRDGREITPEQRRKIYALIRGIANWCGHFPEEIKEYLKFSFEMQAGIEPFSLSSVDVSTASGFIDFLIEFCITQGVPFSDGSLSEYAEDHGKYIYACLVNRVCAVHGTKHAEIHHCTGSRVGMGRDRKVLIHEGLVCIPLCRRCHEQVHLEGEKRFFKRHLIHGIKLDRYLCAELGMKTEAE